MLGLDAMINKKQSYGFSLVELMVAMTIGVIIMGGAVSMNQTTSKVQKINEAQMDMVADARFAIEMISYDLRHAGSWGGTNKNGLIECRSNDAGCATVPTVAAQDCASGLEPVWAYNLDLPVFATDGASPTPYQATCIPADEKYLAGTDILEVRYADANLPLALDDDKAYVRSNFINGRVFVGATVPTLSAYDTSALTQNHELHAYAYYVSDFTDKDGDGIPSLRRVSLTNGPSLQNQLLLSGVTDLQVQFGIDLDDDQIIDSYVNPDAIAAADWENVYAAKIWLLMRSDKKQAVIQAKTYSLAGTNVTVGADGYRYFMVSSVVNLRNLKQL